MPSKRVLARVDGRLQLGEFLEQFVHRERRKDGTSVEWKEDFLQIKGKEG